MLKALDGAVVGNRIKECADEAVIVFLDVKEWWVVVRVGEPSGGPFLSLFVWS